nr:hypothetical protein [Tanacetum cinerariifolium]
MAKLPFCDYHNMVAILEKTEHNTDFYQIVDFLEASHIRYALTISPTIYVSHIRQSWSTARIKTTNQETKILATVDANPTEPHHTPTPQEHHSPQHDPSPPSHQPIISEAIPQAPIETPTLRRYTRRAIQIALSKALSPTADEPTSLSKDDKQGEAFPTCNCITIDQVTVLPLIRGIKEIREDLGEDKSTELGRNDTKEMVNVLSSMETRDILTSGEAAASISPADVLPAAGVPTVSGSFPIPMRSPIIEAKDICKEKVVESEVPKKRKLQE